MLLPFLLRPLHMIASAYYANTGSTKKMVLPRRQLTVTDSHPPGCIRYHCAKLLIPSIAKTGTTQQASVYMYVSTSSITQTQLFGRGTFACPSCKQFNFFLLGRIERRLVCHLCQNPSYNVVRSDFRAPLKNARRRRIPLKM